MTEEPVVTVVDKRDHAELRVYDTEGKLVISKDLSPIESLLHIQQLIPSLLHQQLQPHSQGYWIPHHGYHP